MSEEDQMAKRARGQTLFLGIPDGAVGYALLRFVLGFSILMHGVSRLVSGLAAFADQMTNSFQNTILPLSLVRPFALALPFIETVVGGLVLLGLFTRPALMAGGLLIVALMFGTTLQAKWDVLSQQLLYGALYAALLAAARWNHVAIDTWLARRRAPT